MTAYYGVGNTQYNTGGLTNLVTKRWGTGVCAVYDTYTPPAGVTPAAGSTIYMGRLPKGATVIGFLWTSTAQGAAVTADVTIGSTAATTAEAFTDMTAATTQFVGATGVFPYTPLTADSAIIVTTAAQSMAAESTVTLTTLYIVE